jgi:WD40 repeat protein
LHRLPGQFAFQLAFSPDSRRLALGLYNGGLHILDPNNPQPVDLLPHESVFAVAFSPSGRRLAAGGFTRALIWDLRDLSLKPETVPAAAVHGLSFAAEDRLFVAHTSGASMLQRGRRSELAAWSITRSSREIIPPALSPDSALVAFAPFAGTVMLFDTRTLQPVTTLYAPENSVIRSIAFTADSKTLIAFDQSWKLYRFPVPFEALLREVARRAPEPLTDDDCERYIRQSPCPVQIAALGGKQ